MPQVDVLRDNRAVIHSFVDGDRIVRPTFRETETDALAHALWLVRHRSAEEAERYLDEYIQRNSSRIRH
ncbi:MAG: hypothetical protein UW22_C0066G0009 [Candidatus Gottesmanbacteria bacterium GW2011_GWB1_44_11c]|uniref:Uncharacterized protein n=1 Tax=Candidatus Gottesmanbacteria bacterium GW2011_GWB1_44_11c TaxID=1618447 RepID=A0A0G1JHB7_9BACT|nr:MAG: hypothetical protein UW22_C0066G0009 [Candidatus Gottesmanbacteria bacterium GW2011_GWB1_44_11c]